MNTEVLIDDFAHGIEERKYVSVITVGRHFVLFKIDGHLAWDGNGCPRVYVPVQFVLIHKKHWWLGRDVEKREWSGRTSHKELITAFQQADRIGKLL